MKNKIGMLLSGLIFLSVLLIGGFYYIFCDFEKSIQVTLNIYQIFALIFGSVWAYYSLGWGKRAESATTLKAALNKFKRDFNTLAAQYRADSKDDILKGMPINWIGFVLEIMPHYNEVVLITQNTAYLPKELKTEILETIFLIYNNNKPPKNPNDIDENWSLFETKMKEIEDRLERFTSI